MPDIISVGEVLIDFISNEVDIDLKDVSTFIKFPGGAPANVLVVVASLGAEAGLISRVGKDPFGTFLLDTLKENYGLRYDREVVQHFTKIMEKEIAKSVRPRAAVE